MVATSDKLKKVGDATVTTLAAPGKALGATSITVGATTNYPTDTGVIIAIRVVDTSGALVAGTYTEFEATVTSGTTFSLDPTPVYGSDQVYAAGSTTQVYIGLSKYGYNTLIDTLLGIGVLQTGAFTPKITTSINDTNGNEVIKTPATASAVNEWTDTNAATGNPVRRAATGGDTNIDAYFSGKGTGSGRWAGVHDGWVACDETLTYASATTFTCSAALAANFTTGDKIKLTQTTAKYFYVVSVSGTTVTVTGGTDYTLANAAITLPFYSKEKTPTGFPNVFNWLPTFTNLTVGNGTLVSTFSMQARDVFFTLTLTLGGTSSIGTDPTFTFPVATVANYMNKDYFPIGIGGMNDVSVSGAVTVGAVTWSSTTIGALVANNAGGTYITEAGLNATLPFTWASGDRFGFTGSYRAA